ncbi:hypothetical protein Btru_017813 [Bulinus truncatus]|nr:hypothetical protein Btru_017813 [Bulinus truncatus]
MVKETGQSTCGPGTYWKNRRCIECPVGFYQQFHSKSCCDKCPTGTVTAGRGSTIQEHCVDDPSFLYNFQLGYWADNQPLPEDTLFDEICGGRPYDTSITRVFIIIVFVLIMGAIFCVLGKKFYQNYEIANRKFSITKSIQTLTDTLSLKRSSIRTNISSSEDKKKNLFSTSV